MTTTTTTTTTHRVFVYGTLRQGECNHRLLADAKLVGVARTIARFTMHNLGYFPGVVAAGTTAIRGEVYEVTDAQLAELDRLEGHPRFYCREIVDIVGAGGEPAWMYVLPTGRVKGYNRIAGGDWMRKEGARACV